MTTTTRKKPVAGYRSGVALLNRLMRDRYGKDQFVIVRSPAGYYYWRGEDPRAMSLPSVYWYSLPVNEVADLLVDVESDLRKMEPRKIPQSHTSRKGA